MQPKLFEFVFNNRDKRKLAAQLNVRAANPVLHVSARYPARLGCIAAVVPLAMHPVNRNGVIVFDLRSDPAPLLQMSADEIRTRLYTANADLPEGVERIPLKVVHVNRAPVVVPLGTLTDAARDARDAGKGADRRSRSGTPAAPCSRALGFCTGFGFFRASREPMHCSSSGSLRMRRSSS